MKHHQVPCESEVGATVCWALPDLLENRQASLQAGTTLGIDWSAPSIPCIPTMQVLEATK